MVEEYKENIILPPPQFRDDCKPVAKPRTKITNQALKNHAALFEVNLKHNKDPLPRLEKRLNTISKFLTDLNLMNH